jgi:hypothetical protein
VGLVSSEKCLATFLNSITSQNMPAPLILEHPEELPIPSQIRESTVSFF